MIIQFGIQSSTFAASLPFFNCSWISRFPDEDERVFINGMCPIRVETVKMMNDHRDYRKLFDALHLFDFILNGSIGNLNMIMTANARMIDELLSNQGVVNPKQMMRLTKTLNELVNCGFSTLESLNAINDSNNDESKYDDISFDPYITSMFHAYTRQKRHILINLAAMYHVLQIKSADFYSMIIEGAWLEVYETYKAKVNAKNLSFRANLLSSNIFKMIPNIETIIIETAHTDTHCFAFNLLFFLKNISVSAKWRQIKVQNTTNVRIASLSWIGYLWDTSALDLQREYGKQHLEIQFDRVVTHYDGIIDVKEFLIITKNKPQ